MVYEIGLNVVGMVVELNHFSVDEAALFHFVQREVVSSGNEEYPLALLDFKKDRTLMN